MSEKSVDNPHVNDFPFTIKNREPDRNHYQGIVCANIDNILPYGYETNHVSALISITSSGSILVSRVKSIILVLQFYTR